MVRHSVLAISVVVLIQSSFDLQRLLEAVLVQEEAHPGTCLLRLLGVISIHSDFGDDSLLLFVKAQPLVGLHTGRKMGVVTHLPASR